MKNSTELHRQHKISSFLPLARIAFRKRVEIELNYLPQRLFGVRENCVKMRVSNGFIRYLLRNGLHLKSTAQEIGAGLEKSLTVALSRFLSCGQLTFGDVLMIRAQTNSADIQIERVSSRDGKVAMKSVRT